MRPLATVRDYRELVLALRARADELNVSGEVLDFVTNLPDGYCRKLLAPTHIRALGRISLGVMLSALGLKLIVAEDAEAFERVKRRLTPRKNGSTWARPYKTQGATAPTRRKVCLRPDRPGRKTSGSGACPKDRQLLAD
jgi:hypothetical protein